MTGSGVSNGKRLSLCIKGRNRPIDGSVRRALTRFGGVDEVNPKWMPDGQSIVFEQLREPRPAIGYRLDHSGRSRRARDPVHEGVGD